jgi:hypothetical protein
MPNPRCCRWLGGAALLLAAASVGFAYIHFPPMTLWKMCKTSHHVRVLKIDQASKERGVILFEAGEALKGDNSKLVLTKHVVRTDTEGAKPVFDWIGEGKTAVMFYVEGGGRGLGYVFIDQYCYSVDYNTAGKYWLAIRGEPSMSLCYYGSVELLQSLVKDTLAGKEVKVPTKAPEKKEDAEKRKDTVNRVLNKNKNN